MSPPTTSQWYSSVTSEYNQSVNSPSSSSATNRTSKRKRKSKSDEQIDNVLSMVGEKLRSGNNVEDEFNIFGKHVAAKLRMLPKELKLYTEKANTWFVVWGGKRKCQ